MLCPKCDGEMNQVNTDPVSIHRCNDCQGLYFEQLTQNMVDSLVTCTGVDTGDAEKGAEYDDVVFVDCPNCFRMMDQRVADEPHRIRFEVCPSCYATFLDAGEFRHYMTTAVDAFRALLPGD